jgi:16S rRNA (adenine1518-N6/adenine1519-N6)-dimethyltransferase
MIFAKKSFGQHFLRDQSVLDKIVAAADIGPHDLVVEIGPGRGALTGRLADVGDRLILVEADRELIPELETRFPQAKIVQADAAHVDYGELVGEREWVLVGNLPYNAGNAIIRQALTSAHPPKRQVVMLQREVGEKMLAKPGDMSILSVAVQMYADVKRIGTVKPGAFVPPPKVDSIVLLLMPNQKSSNPEAVIALAKTAFAHKRKQMHRTLADAGIGSSESLKAKLNSLSLSEQARPEEVSIGQWIELANQ